MKSYDSVVLTFRLQGITSKNVIPLLEQYLSSIEETINIKAWEIFLLNGEMLLFVEVSLEQKRITEENLAKRGFTMIKQISPDVFKMVKRHTKKLNTQFYEYFNSMPVLATFGIV